MVRRQTGYRGIIVIKRLILGTAIFSMATLANAQGADATAVTTKEVAATEDININADKSDVASAKTNCVTETGSRIRHKDKKGCNGLPGRSYDKEDIDRTGANSIGEALQMLDPSIQIRR